MKIAVVIPNWVGDAVMATPALRGLRDRFADAEIVAVLRPHIADVLTGTGLVDRTIAWDPRGKDLEARGWRLVGTLRRERLDLMVLFPNSLRSGWLAWMSGAERRVGFAKNGRGLLLTDAIMPKPRKPPHPVIDDYLRLAEHLGCTNLARQMELATLPEDEARLDAFWARKAKGAALRIESDPPPPPLPKGGSQNPGVVCLNPGGAFGAAKHWPTAYFAELARRIATELGRTVLVLCGPGERDEARRIAAAAAHPQVVSLAEETPSIGLTKAAIRRAELLVTTDSGPRHFAAPFNVPVITLFGPTHIAWSETYSENATHLQIPVACGPCQKRTCPLGHHRCMTDLTVDRVFAAVVAQLQRTAQRHAA